MLIPLQSAMGGGNGLFLLGMFVIMMVFMIYPQIRRQKQEKKFLEALKKGDKVVMKSGLHGKIIELNDNSVIIETLAGKLKFERGAISLDYTQRMSKTDLKSEK